MKFQRLLYRLYCWAAVRGDRMRRRIRKQGVFLLTATAFACIVGLNTRMTMAYQVFTLFLAILLVSLLFCFRFRPRFRFVRHSPRFGTAGEPLNYRITVSNDSDKIQKGLCLFDVPEVPFPTEREFTKVPEPGEERRNRFDQVMGVYRWRWHASKRGVSNVKEIPLPALPPYGSCDVRLSFTPRKRGLLRMVETEAARPDPFGLFNALRRAPTPQTFLILPRRYPVPQYELPGKRRHHKGGVALASSVGESEEFVSLRDYRPGDPLRRIHWKSWAKTGRPVIKEHQEEYFVRHALILDTFQKEENDDIFEAAVSVAASFACMTRSQDSMLDIMFVGDRTYCFSSGRGAGETDHVLEVLASVEPCRDKSFSELQNQVMSRNEILSGCILVLLSWDAERKRFVEQLKGANLPTRVMVVTTGDSSIDPEPEPAGNLSDGFLTVNALDVETSLSEFR